jgi:hypothetical protein
MKRALILVLAGVFTLALIGCRAEVDTTKDNPDSSSSYKKTTKVDTDTGAKTTYEKKTVTNP